MIKLNNNLSIKTIHSFYAQLKKEFEQNTEIVLDFSDLRRVDLSIVQLIITANRKAAKMQKIIKLKNMSHEVKKQMYICGLKTL